MIRFLLNQRLVSEEAIDPGLTVLNYLRQSQRRCGTKQGCASGDCGACTVTLGSVENGKMRYQTVNSCVTLVSHLHGKQLISVEDLQQADALHPVQQSMVDCHASQCGFCTPGFVMSLFTLQKNGAHTDGEIEQALGGNLCRCTGYRPIVAAAREACATAPQDSFRQQEADTVARLRALQSSEMLEIAVAGRRCLLPATVDQLASVLSSEPQATLLAGGTDLTLQLAQKGTAPPLLVALQRIDALKQCRRDDDEILLGAGATLTDCWQFLQDEIPHFTQLLARFASLQIRNHGTLGGNLANASPVGDTAPMLLALDAELLLQQGATQRRLPLEQFFLAFRQTALRPGEFIRAVVIPRSAIGRDFRAWKVSKRREDDISTVAAAFTLSTDRENRVTHVRMAFGGMAATPKRARHAEQQLLGQTWSPASLELACGALEQDFTPLNDLRGSAAWRLQLAKNLLRRYYAAQTDELTLTEIADYVP